MKTRHLFHSCRNRAILDYLLTSGYRSSLEAFRREANLDSDADVEKRHAGLLEKKWTSVIRLQKKVGSLIAEL
jgi:platelet-activating factor acetylhydrolase IB subunit alpha